MTNPIDSLRQALRQNTEGPKKEAKPVCFLQNFCVGSVAGLAAVFFLQPFSYFKGFDQDVARKGGKKLPLRRFFRAYGKDLRVWYRGIGVNAVGFAPTIALQSAAKGIFSTMMDPLSSAAAAGIASAFVVCPVEGIMIQQQKIGKGLWATTSSMYSTHGLSGFFRALVPTIVREGVFTTAYLGFVPEMKKMLKEFGANELTATVTAGVSAGLVAGTVTQPVDTLKTQRQQNLDSKIPLIEGIFEKSSFAGFRWRACIVVIAVTMIPFLQHILNEGVKQKEIER